MSTDQRAGWASLLLRTVTEALRNTLHPRNRDWTISHCGRWAWGPHATDERGVIWTKS
jgi:hypothetical protein